MAGNGPDPDFESMVGSLYHNLQTIKNLTEGRNTFVLDKGKVDERLFNELKICRNLIKDMEKHFLGMLLQDARKISQAAINNPNITSEKASEILEKIWYILHDFIKEESVHIKKSKYLKKLALELRDEIKKIDSATGINVKKVDEVNKKIMEELSKSAYYGN